LLLSLERALNYALRLFKLLSVMPTELSLTLLKVFPSRCQELELVPVVLEATLRMKVASKERCLLTRTKLESLQ